MGALPEIPYVDLSGGSPVDLLRQFPERARALARATRAMFGATSQLAAPIALPLGDRISRRWLERAGNPYLPEIDAMAHALRMHGVYALNVCFEWGCTSGAFRMRDGVELRRVLDWMFPRLGEFIVVARQDGSAGDCHNVTWPGLSGVYQAMAPGRFSAAINQAPMRRHDRGVAFDWLKNRVETKRSAALPPAHLLRQVFETAPDYSSAKAMLRDTPIAVPAIFILSGVLDGEGCVIERTETDAAVRELGDGDCVCVTNHFQSRLSDTGRGWMPRPIDSLGRAQAALAMPVDCKQPFEWFVPPIANAHSRLVMESNVATGSLRVMGVDGAAPVTQPFVAVQAIAA